MNQPSSERLILIGAKADVVSMEEDTTDKILNYIAEICSHKMWMKASVFVDNANNGDWTTLFDLNQRKDVLLLYLN